VIPRNAGPFFVLAAIFLWSSLGVVVRLSGVPVPVLIFYSALVALAVQTPIIFRKHYRARISRGRGLLKILVLGPVTLANLLAFFYAYTFTTISNAIMTHYIAPVVVAFLAPVFLKETLTRGVLLSLLVSSLGLWILLDMHPGEFIATLRAPGSDAMGIFLGLLSGVAYAVLILLVRAFARNHNPLVLTFFQNAMMCLMLLPFVKELPLHALWSFVFVGVVHSTVAPVLYFRGLRDVRANRTAILGYVEPVCAILFGIIFLGEYPSVVSVAGGALILFSGYLTLREGRGN
jgi:drug/metabolite transporter (DMT)-like permease